MALDHIKTQGIVTECLPGCKFKVKLVDANDKEIVCTLSGKLRINQITIVEGDDVEVKISPYDLSKGIISWRNK